MTTTMPQRVAASHRIVYPDTSASDDLEVAPVCDDVGRHLRLAADDQRVVVLDLLAKLTDRQVGLDIYRGALPQASDSLICNWISDEHPHVVTSHFALGSTTVIVVIISPITHTMICGHQAYEIETLHLH